VATAQTDAECTNQRIAVECKRKDICPLEVPLGVAKTTKAVLTDSHFLVPFIVLIAGIVLLIALH
jgi:hypothetical protein